MLNSMLLNGDNLRHMLSVATIFWALCLLLVAAEAAFGDNVVTGSLFFLSVPLLVGGLLWANRTVLVYLKRGPLQAVLLGVYVLACATVIVFVGLFAAANLKTLMVGS